MKKLRLITEMPVLDETELKDVIRDLRTTIQEDIDTDGAFPNAGDWSRIGPNQWRSENGFSVTIELAEEGN